MIVTTKGLEFDCIRGRQRKEIFHIFDPWCVDDIDEERRLYT